MSRTYFAGDTHWGHRNILKYRKGFEDREQHDLFILNQFLATCGKNDTLWLLGDILFDMDSIRYLEELSRHVGRINWVLGNHDTDSSERQQIVRKVLMDGLVNKVGALFKTHGAWISHAPIHPAELRGKLNVHGHVHTDTLDDPRYINVSVDNLDNYQPFAGSKVKELYANTKEIRGEATKTGEENG